MKNPVKSLSEPVMRMIHMINNDENNHRSASKAPPTEKQVSVFIILITRITGSDNNQH
jgi:hypothetical protein